MKTRIEFRPIIRLSLVTMLAIGIATTQSLLISRGSAAPTLKVKTYRSATHQPDEIGAVVQVAKDAITSLNASNSAGVQAVSSALENFAAAVAGLDNQSDNLAALDAAIKATTQAIEALVATINALQSQIENLHQRIEELRDKAEALGQCRALTRAVSEQYAEMIQQLQSKIAEAEAKNQSTTSLKQALSTLQNKRDQELKKLEASCARVLSETRILAEQVEKTAKVRKILNKLSTDRTKASQLVELIRNNNRTGLSEFLQREAGGGDFVISDAKAVTGPLLIFRVDSISHCLSVASQCSGKSYLFTR